MKYSDIGELSSITKLSLNVSEESAQGACKQKVYAKQHDRTSRYLEVNIMSGDENVVLPIGAIPRIRCTKPDGTSVLNDGCIHNGKIYVEISAQMLAVPGVVGADIGIYKGESVLSTASFDIEITEMPFDEDNISSADEFSVLTEALNTVGNIYAFEAELEDVRKDTDGNIHETAGQAVRAQFDAVNTLIYNKRTEENTRPTVMLKYSGEMTTLADMPADSWAMMSGNELTALLGSSFPWELGVSRTYKLTRYNWSNISVVVFEIESITGLERYVGYSSEGVSNENISEIKWNNLNIGDILGKRDALPEWYENILITDFSAELAEYADGTEYDGWWTKTGSYFLEEGKIRRHSRLIPVVPGKDYYLGYNNSLSCTGAFFDKDGNWIAPLETLTEYEYHTADGGNGKESYATIYTFTAPEEARYFSYNLVRSESAIYRQFVSSSPILALSNSGDYCFNNNYPAYQAHKDKKLCVIGASGVAYNRAEKNIDGLDQYLIGFQEYLAPWYAIVESYGFAGGGYRQNDASEYPSIYKGIIEGGVVGNVDLSGYDEFLIIPSTNDLALSNMGEIDSTDTATYFGGLNAIISKIYAESPNAKIYLANAMHKGSYYTNSGTKEKIDTLNARLAALADYDSLQLIDLAGGSGVNRFNYAEGNMTYDGTHLNHEGNKRMGLYLRKEMVGI